jgi:hypothetical protein
MIPLDKIAYLKAGEFDKVLEGSAYYKSAPVPDFSTGSLTWKPNGVSGANLLYDAKANAAKVEVTKGVLEEAERLLTGIVEPTNNNYGCPKFLANQALTLLKSLQEAL